MRIDYKIQDKFDFGIFVPLILLFCLGLAAIYSSTLNNPLASGNFEKQIIFGVIAIIIFFITYSLPTNTFKTIAVPTYLFSLLLLIIVVLLGRKIAGQKSWITIGSLGFQPSELAKIGMIFGVSYFLSKRNTDIESFKDIIYTLGIGLFPVLLILLEPDMGTSLVFFGTLLVLIYWKGISLFGMFVVLSPAIVAFASVFGFMYFIIMLVLVAIVLFLFKKDIFFSGSIFAINLGAGFFADYVFKALSQHQQNRILSFVNPYADPLGTGYNSIQAKVAIGSGGFFGKGFLNGHQTQLQFIPEQWTDFIYCVIGEEFGFIGSVFTLILFLIIFLRIFKIATSTNDEFLSLTLIGILSIYFIHLFINIGMTVGVMPVIGIPLPFVSYGGSSLLVNMFMLGIVANVYRTRRNYI